MIRIKSKQAGFRRCGIAHQALWVEYPDDKFSPEELKRLEAEPMLDVEKGQAGKDAAGAKKKGGK